MRVDEDRVRTQAVWLGAVSAGIGGLIHWSLASLVAGWVSVRHPRRADLELPALAASPRAVGQSRAG